MPSSSVSITQSLPKDPLHTIEGDLSLLITQLLTPEEQKLPFSTKKQLVVERQGEMKNIRDLAETGEKAYGLQKQTLEQTQSTMPEATSTTQFSFAGKIFDLAKFAQGMNVDPNMGMEQPQQPSQDAGNFSLPTFADASDLRSYLIEIGPDQAIRVFGSLVSNNPENEQTLDDALSRFFESNDPERTLQLSTVIFDMLPQAVKSLPDTNQGDTQVTGIEQRVAESNEAIRQAAVLAAVKNNSTVKKSFNLKEYKTAQHKGLENVMMFGPNQVRIDPATGQLISNWHVYERNKGWGIKMPDAMDVDFETLWRQNIMDKYSRPYRNDDGEYVGGYINKRFEVDRSIPEGNNYQLLPNQKRRAYLPEYRSTEARLQDMRSKPNKNGWEFANTDKPTDWAKEGTDFKTFNFKRDVLSKKSDLTKKADFFDIITAQVDLPRGGMPKMNMPGHEPITGGPRCNVCGSQLPNPTESKNQMKGNLTNCPNCGAAVQSMANWVNPFGQQKQNPFNKGVTLNVSAQSVPMPGTNKIIAPPANPVMERRVHRQPPVTPQINAEPYLAQQELSDENAEKRDVNHLNNVNSSANALGL